MCLLFWRKDPNSPLLLFSRNFRYHGKARQLDAVNGKNSGLERSVPFYGYLVLESFAQWYWRLDRRKLKYLFTWSGGGKVNKRMGNIREFVSLVATFLMGLISSGKALYPIAYEAITIGTFISAARQEWVIDNFLYCRSPMVIGFPINDVLVIRMKN